MQWLSQSRDLVPFRGDTPLESVTDAPVPAALGSSGPREELPDEPLQCDRTGNLMSLLPWQEELNGWLQRVVRVSTLGNPIQCKEYSNQNFYFLLKVVGAFSNKEFSIN